jgi:hypothetical protein
MFIAKFKMKRLREVDFFSKEISLKFRGQDRYSTFIGSFLSALILLGVTLVLVIKILKIYYYSLTESSQFLQAFSVYNPQLLSEGFELSGSFPLQIAISLVNQTLAPSLGFVTFTHSIVNKVSGKILTSTNFSDGVSCG